MSRNIIIISVVIILISIGGGLFFWWPNLQEFLDLREVLEEKQKMASQKEEYFNELSSISSKLDNYKGELAKIDSALSLEPSIPALFEFIRRASLENGLAIDALALGSISASDEIVGANEIHFSVSLSGTYPAFKNFLSTIHKSGRMIEAESISFSSQGEESSLFTFSTSMLTYFYPEREE